MIEQEIRIGNNDLLIMNLVHYFITEKNYNPVILHGINDEIWLENLDCDYKIIRIVSHYIHNNEQMNFDKFKLKRIIKGLKKQTLSFNLPVVSIYTNLGDDVSLGEDDKNSLNFYINKISKVNNKKLIEAFPDIVEKTKHDEKGIELFVKISENINKESFIKTRKVERVFMKKKPYATYTVMFICFIMFLITLIYGSGSILNISAVTLFKYGGLEKNAVLHGEYYRLITCLFLHAGIIHLICNMYSLFVIGPQIESFYGRCKYIFILLFSGISGSILSLAFLDTSVVSVGISGAIFGLLGSILYFGYHYRIYLGNSLKSQIIPIILLNLGLGLFLTGIDTFAHLGGLIGGVLASMAMGVVDKSSNMDKINGYILSFIYLIFICYLAFIR